jgi:hypothetical protein
MVTDKDRLIASLIDIYNRNNVEYDSAKLRESINQAAKGLFGRLEEFVSYPRVYFIAKDADFAAHTDLPAGAVLKGDPTVLMVSSASAGMRFRGLTLSNPPQIGPRGKISSSPNGSRRRSGLSSRHAGIGSSPADRACSLQPARAVPAVRRPLSGRRRVLLRIPRHRRSRRASARVTSAAARALDKR